MQPVEWRPTTADMLWHEFAEAGRTFRTTVLDPSCAALDQPETSDGHTAKYHKQIAAQSAKKALALALAGLWESQFREHLGKSANIIQAGNITSSKVERTTNFRTLMEQFKTVRGFPMDSFPQYPTIDALILVANAARHGNGYSSGSVHKDHGKYFSSSRPHAGWYSYFLHGATQPQDVRYLNITTEHLIEFSDATISFWEEIGRISKSAEKGSV